MENELLIARANGFAPSRFADVRAAKAPTELLLSASREEIPWPYCLARWLKRIFFCSSVIGLRSSAPSAWPRLTAGRAPIRSFQALRLGNSSSGWKFIAAITQPQQA